jgi:hypothetical protein
VGRAHYREAAGQDGTWWKKADAEAAELAHVRDPVIDAASAEARADLAEIWQRRGGFELRVAAGFAIIATELFEHGADPSVLQIVARAVRDEIHHAELSIDVAARYRGDGPRWPRPAATPVPELAPASPTLRTTLHVVAMCCINETIACACLDAALGQTKTPLVRAAQQLILSDEVEHARAGWAHLASRHVSEEMKAELSGWLVRLFSAKLRELIEEDTPLPGEKFPEHGMLSRDVTTQVVAATLRTLLLPGFARAGIDTAAAERWTRETFPE